MSEKIALNTDTMKIGGIQKLTLLDYPGKVACTIFTAGCNMKCPFCHNRDLVFVPKDMVRLDPEEILIFLDRRQGILEGVAITGGEPLMQPGLVEFLRRIKELGYPVKLDTNGLMPGRLGEIIDEGLVDYVAMDIKNCPEKYAATAGLSGGTDIMDIINSSIDVLRNSGIEHEFRTTVVREFHTRNDLVGAAQLIKGEENYYLQQFVDSGMCIEEGHTGYDRREMKQLLEEVRKVIPTRQLRGV